MHSFWATTPASGHTGRVTPPHCQDHVTDTQAVWWCCDVLVGTEVLFFGFSLTIFLPSILSQVISSSSARECLAIANCITPPTLLSLDSSRSPTTRLIDYCRSFLHHFLLETLLAISKMLLIVD